MYQHLYCCILLCAEHETGTIHNSLCVDRYRYGRLISDRTGGAQESRLHLILQSFRLFFEVAVSLGGTLQWPALFVTPHSTGVLQLNRPLVENWKIPIYLSDLRLRLSGEAWQETKALLYAGGS